MMMRVFNLPLFAAVMFGVIVAGSVQPFAADNAKPPAFRVCNATFALCTIAMCDPIPGNPGQVTCHCTVNEGYSVGSGQVACEDLQKQRPKLSSRYYPTKVVAKCSEDRPWAFCLDSPCQIDENNPRAASCQCTLENTKKTSDPVVPWVVVTSAYSPATCTTGIVSSATVKDVETVTEFLKSNTFLRPFRIRWLPEMK